MSNGSYQKLIIVGNLGTDPEMRMTASGEPVTNFSVAYNNNSANRETGEATEVTTWFRVSVWGKQAEICNQYLSKGRQVLVEGRLNPDKTTGGPRLWIDQNGKTRASFEMTAFEVRFLGGNGNSSNGHTLNSSRAESFPEVTEDEIPF